MANIPALIYKDDVLAMAPELVDLSTFAWEDVLAYCNEIDLGRMGETASTTRLLRIFLTAHMGSLALRAISGAAGPTTGESAGSLRRSYGIVSLSAADWLGSTMYGQQYMTILRMSVAHGPRVV